MEARNLLQSSNRRLDPCQLQLFSLEEEANTGTSWLTLQSVQESYYQDLIYEERVHKWWLHRVFTPKLEDLTVSSMVPYLYLVPLD
jgi:hypothetical protein